MASDSEDDYDHLSQDAFSECEHISLVEALDHIDAGAGNGNAPDTPASSPPETSLSASSKTIPSRTKRLKCTWEGCDKAFVRQSRLDEHLRTHTNTRIFACPEAGCTKSYFRDSHLKVHIKSAHSVEKDYKCTWPDCDKGFATGQRLRNHLKTHECREKYRCTGYEGCSEAFRKKEMLRRHVASVHEQRKPFPCSEVDSMTGEKCTKEFDTAQKLRNHKKTNHNETRYSCAVCLDSSTGAKAYFATLVQLQAHNDEFHPPTCPHCSTVCVTQRQLKAHIEIHHNAYSESARRDKDSKPRVVCPHPGCGKTYSKTGNLNMHIRTIHQGSEKFICGRSRVMLAPGEVPENTSILGCGKTYSAKQALEDHIRRDHLGLESLQSRRNRKRKSGAGKARRAAKKARIAWAGNLAGSGKGEKGIDELPAFVWPAVAINDSGEGNQDYDSDDDDDDDAVEDENDGTNALSESVSMLGSHIFHRGESFHYPSGEYPPSFGSLDLARESSSSNTNPDRPSNSGNLPLLTTYQSPSLPSNALEPGSNTSGSPIPYLPFYEPIFELDDFVVSGFPQGLDDPMTIDSQSYRYGFDSSQGLTY